MLIIGSHALKFHYGDKIRQPVDLDVICHSGELLDFLVDNKEDISNFRAKNKHKFICNSKKYNQIEFELASLDNSSAHYLQRLHNNELNDGLNRFLVASKQILFSIKKSHIHYPYNFDKHIQDYTILGNDLGFKDCYSDITKLRENETIDYYGKIKTPRLNVELDSFFNYSVKRYFNHDDVHKVMAMAVNSKPAYTYMQLPGQTTAKVHKDLFDKLDESQKLNTVYEEAAVLALERFLIPFLFGDGKYIDKHAAFKYCLTRLATNLSSGWWREYVVNNYIKILENYNFNYIEQFLLQYQTGKIKCLNP